MGWFMPKLRPGETLIGQLPARPTKRQLLPGVIMALLAGAAYFGLAFWVREPARALLALPASIGAGLLVLAAFWSGHYWAVALTDRRLLVRRDFPWRAPYEIPRSEVESVRMDSAAYKIRIRGGRQEIAVDPMRVGYAELKRLLGLAGEAAP